MTPEDLTNGRTILQTSEYTGEQSLAADGLSESAKSDGPSVAPVPKAAEAAHTEASAGAQAAQSTHTEIPQAQAALASHKETLEVAVQI